MGSFSLSRKFRNDGTPREVRGPAWHRHHSKPEDKNEAGNAEPREQISCPGVKRRDTAYRHLGRHRAITAGKEVGHAQDAAPRVSRRGEPGPIANVMPQMPVTAASCINGRNPYCE